MQLNDAQIKKISEKIESLSRHNCPFCNNKLQLNPSVFELREFASGDLKVGNSTTLFPLIVLTCKECGHTEFFSAVFLGIFNDIPKHE